MAQADVPYIMSVDRKQRLAEVRDLISRNAMRPLRAEPRRQHRSLADDVDFQRPSSRWVDDDCELGAWPELIDQTKLPDHMLDGCYHEDAEVDDDDTGIDDYPHDPVDEDGI